MSTIVPYISSPVVQSPLGWRVVVGGSVRSDLVVRSVVRRPAPHFDKAILELLSADCPAQAQQLERLPAVGHGVTISAGPLCIEGIVTAHQAGISDQGETLAAVVESRLAVQLDRPLLNAFAAIDGKAVRVLGSPVAFNTASSLASADPHSVNGRWCRVVDSGPDVRPWTVADALACLFAMSLGRDVHAPSHAQLARLAGSVDMPPTDLTGRSARDAIAVVAALAGLEIRAAEGLAALEVYRPGRDCPLRSPGLQRPGQKLNPLASDVLTARVEVLRRPCRGPVLLTGTPKRYECTFELSAGWAHADQSARWRDTVRSLCDDWERRGQVFRRWVLNEHGRYCGQPWNLPVADLAAINAEDFTSRVARPLLPCLTTTSDGTSMGVVVETSTDGQQWRRWRGPLWVARDEAAVYLGGDALAGDFFSAAVEGQARVRVTACLEADARISLRAVGDESLPTTLINLGQRANWRQIHASSVLAGRDGTGEPLICDDTELLQAVARRLAMEHSAIAGMGDRTPTVEATITLSTIQPLWRVGDRLEKIAGRDLQLAAAPHLCPRVTEVTHDATRQTTTLRVKT